jgi:hypothetical protein
MAASGRCGRDGSRWLERAHHGQDRRDADAAGDQQYVRQVASEAERADRARDQ